MGCTDEDIREWLSDKTRQLPSDALDAIAGLLDVHLPEVDVGDFRRSGYLPEVIVNFIALLGWNPGEKDEQGRDVERFDIDYLCAHFSLDRVGKKPSKFDRDKLRAFNAHRIQHELTAAEFAHEWRAWLGRWETETLARLEGRFELAAMAAQPRATTLADAADAVRFALIDDDAVTLDEKAVNSALLKQDGQGLGALSELQGVLADVRPFEPAPIEEAVKAWCEAHQVRMKVAAQALRVAVTGSMVSPGLGQTLALVGDGGADTRITRCVEVAKTQGP